MGERATRKSRTKNFLAKPKTIQNMIDDAICVLHALGVSQEKGNRQKEKTAMIFLALADMKVGTSWKSSANLSGRTLTTRNIIDAINANFCETISRGSYDDIRRKGVAELMRAGIVEESMPWAAKNDSRRGYGISVRASRCLRQYGTPRWESAVSKMKATRKPGPITRRITSGEAIHVNNRTFKMSTGVHNRIQKNVIEVLLPRMCKHAKILYFGDSNKRNLVYEKSDLYSIGINVSIRGTLPDIIAYSAQKNSVYIIEAVHTSNPVSELRRKKLAELCKKCRAYITYITVFESKKSFQKSVPRIAWKTKVWLVDNPDHMISFNGE